MVFNGATIVRRKVETSARGKQAIVTPAKDEKEIESKGSGIAEPVQDKKALQAKLRAELFKSL